MNRTLPILMVILLSVAVLMNQYSNSGGSDTDSSANQETVIVEPTGDSEQSRFLLSSLRVTSDPAAELDFTPLSEKEYSAVEALFLQIMDERPDTNQYQVEEITTFGRYSGGTVVFIRHNLPNAFKQKRVIGTMLFTYPDYDGEHWLYTGSGLVPLSDAYDAGLVPYSVLKAVHEAWYREDAELESLYCSDYAAVFLRELFGGSNVILERISSAENRTPDGPAVQAALSGTWDGNTLAERYFEEPVITMPGTTVEKEDWNTNSILVTSPDYEGYAVYVTYRYSFADASVCLRTPEGSVAFVDEDYNTLYVLLRDQYEAAAEGAGLTDSPGEQADYELYADIDHAGCEEVIRVTGKDGGVHIDIQDSTGLDLIVDSWWESGEDGPYVAYGYGMDIEDGALMLAEIDGESYILIYEEEIAEDGSRGTLRLSAKYIMPGSDTKGLNTWYKESPSVSWETVSGILLAGQDALADYLLGAQALLEHSVLICSVENGRVVLGNDESAPSCQEVFPGLQPFYEAYTEIYPEVRNESVALSERLEQLKEAVKKQYNETHTVYTVTSSFGSVQALNRDRFGGVQHVYTLEAYGCLDSFPWLEADLGHAEPFRIDPYPENALNNLLGTYTVYEYDSLWDTELKTLGSSRSGYLLFWTGAEEGKRYIVIGADVNADHGYIICGVIQRSIGE